MKIVIDIPEEIYTDVKENYHGNDVLYSEVKYGTPLPKGHGRLIDADVLADGFEDNFEFCEVVNATPTIIEAESENHFTDIGKMVGYERREAAERDEPRNDNRSPE